MKLKLRMGIVILVLVIIAAIYLFRREGYTLTDQKKEELTKLFDKFEISPDDKITITKALEMLPKEEENIKQIIDKYPGFVNELKVFAKSLKPRNPQQQNTAPNLPKAKMLTQSPDALSRFTCYKIPSGSYDCDFK